MKLYCGARQLQALVRLRSTSHSSGPSPTRSTEGHSPSLPSRRRGEAEWTSAWCSPASTRPARNGTFLWIAP